MSYASFKTLGREDAPDPESMMEVPRILSGKQRTDLINNNRVVVIDNYTDWCGPCKQCAPHFAQLAKQFYQPGICVFAKENVEDKCEGCPVIYGVPCFHFYVQGQRLDQLTVTGADVGEVTKTLTRLMHGGN